MSALWPMYLCVAVATLVLLASLVALAVERGEMFPVISEKDRESGNLLAAVCLLAAVVVAMAALWPITVALLVHAEIVHRGLSDE